MPQVFVGRTDIQSDIWLNNITFRKGEKYLIEAASGTGKSSLCSYLLGYRNDYRGSIKFDQAEISNFSIGLWTDIRQHSLSMLFQELRLFPELTALENIELKNEINHQPFRSKEEIDGWFEAFGISDKRNQKIGRMSFGQQQRVAFIRALCQPTDFILMDEPVSHLDTKNGTIMRDILNKEAQKNGMGIIVTSIGHHIDMNYDKVIKL